MKQRVNEPTAFSKRLQDYLCVYTPDSMGASQNTLASYCSAFRKYLSFRETVGKIPADKFDLKNFTAESVEAFLDWLEKDCNCKTVTRNQRLAVIHSFCKYLVRKEPVFMNQWQLILAIREKRRPVKKVVDYLTVSETSAILKSVDTTTKLGRRDEVLLCLMYDTAARVQEIADLRLGNIKMYSRETSFVYLTGKGNKTRSVPISSRMYSMLSLYIDEQDLKKATSYVFVNRCGEPLTRHGIAFILKKYVDIAQNEYPLISEKTVSPHTLRHSKAMHLLQAGIDLIKIRDMLGHESVTTTEIYARTHDLDLRAVVNSADGANQAEISSWHSDPGIMEKLASFAKKR